VYFHPLGSRAFGAAMIIVATLSTWSWFDHYRGHDIKAERVCLAAKGQYHKTFGAWRCDLPRPTVRRVGT
jgi:hypothetical protein